MKFLLQLDFLVILNLSIKQHAYIKPCFLQILLALRDGNNSAVVNTIDNMGLHGADPVRTGAGILTAYLHLDREGRDTSSGATQVRH